MVLQNLRYWDVAIDGVQIFLCLLILIFFFKNRKKNKKSIRIEEEIISGNDFNTQIFIQTIKQQVDQAFANICEAITVEQRRLELLPQFQQQVNEYSDISTKDQLSSKLAPIPMTSGLSEDTDKGEEEEQRERILTLSDRGMSVKEISEKLKSPIDKIELVLSLNQNERN